MAKAYITFEPIQADENYVYAGVSAGASGIPDFTALGVWLAFPGDPSAATIRTTLMAYALYEIEAETGVALSAEDAVITNAPT
jgi:hypothetical protein